MAKITLLTADEVREIEREARRKARSRLVEAQIKGEAPRGGKHALKGYTRKNKSWKAEW